MGLCINVFQRSRTHQVETSIIYYFRFVRTESEIFLMRKQTAEIFIFNILGSNMRTCCKTSHFGRIFAPQYLILITTLDFSIICN